MLMIKGPLAVWLVPAALGVGVIGAIDGSIERVGGGPSASQPIRCEIQVKEHGNNVALQGVVFAKTAVEGSYQLRVSKSGGAGSSDINQSGEFSAGPGEPGTLGTVTLGGDGGSYVAKLTVTWHGGSTECTERVRGTL
ncbi:MAG TPA: curli-like amyloid fiber formation chaperone CsgH [Hyphomicrobiaceae bacterium]|nr:curli-like amyloid fiber formation chaperone CsgH [Hyphomicrobiaceae bacterium]